MKFKILVAEPEEMFANAVAYILEQAGMEAVVTHDSRESLDRASLFDPDLCILSSAMPPISQFQLCHDFRHGNVLRPSASLLILATDTHEGTCEALLECGADDYLLKPFGMREFVARVQALLRRSRSGLPQTMPSLHAMEEIQAGRFHLRCKEQLLDMEDGDKRRVIVLTENETKLMQILMCHHNSTVPREAIMRHVWGVAGCTPNALASYVLQLRGKIEKDRATPEHLLSVYGVGLRLKV